MSIAFGGYKGQADDDNYDRLYSALNERHYIDIRKRDILNSFPHNAQRNPYRIVYVRHDAPVRMNTAATNGQDQEVEAKSVWDELGISRMEVLRRYANWAARQEIEQIEHILANGGFDFVRPFTPTLGPECGSMAPCDTMDGTCPF